MLSEAMTAADADGYLLTVCYLDLDRFKPVNDRFGHAAGDRLLVELAGRLRSALRSNEVWSDAAGRLGGDEFVLLLRADDDGGVAPGGRARAARRGAALCHRPQRRPGAGDGQHGRHRLPDRPQRCRHAAAPCRPRDVRRQAGRAQRLPVLRPREPAAQRRARHGHRPRAGGAGQVRVHAALPAQGGHAPRRGAGSGGAGALGPPAARADRADAVPAADREHRAVLARRRLGAGPGAGAPGDVAPRRARHLGQRQRVGPPPAGTRLRAAPVRAAGPLPRCAGHRAGAGGAGNRRPCRHRGHLGAAGALPRPSACALRSTTSAPATRRSPT